MSTLHLLFCLACMLFATATQTDSATQVSQDDDHMEIIQMMPLSDSLQDKDLSDDQETDGELEDPEADSTSRNSFEEISTKGSKSLFAYIAIILGSFTVLGVVYYSRRGNQIQVVGSGRKGLSRLNDEDDDHEPLHISRGDERL